MSVCLYATHLKSAIHLNNLHEALKRNYATEDLSDAKLFNLHT
jgi:hypothetical protein